jgi:hypothetical protein
MKQNLKGAIIIHLEVNLFQFHNKAKIRICLKKITHLIESQEFKFLKKIINKLLIQIEILKLLKMEEIIKTIIYRLKIQKIYKINCSNL